MTIKVGINGFGRIGRCTLAHIAGSFRNDIEVIKVNATGPIETNAHLLKYDSVHGRFGGDIKIAGNTMDIGRGPMEVFSTYNPDELDWSGVDVVLECTGKFNDGNKAAVHLERGAKKVLISAPAKNVQKTIVFGVNDELLASSDYMISNGSCTTNGLAPLAKVLNDAIGIERGVMTTIHSYTGDQPVHDTAHSDLYRARAAALSMIPTTTGAAKTLGKVLPELDGLIGGTAIRVPTPNVSCVDLVVELSKEATVEEVNATLRTAAEGPLKGILGLVERPLVSIDLNHDSHSCVVALDQTSVQSGTQLRVLGWYDNEWGFSNRMLDTSREVAKTL